MNYVTKRIKVKAIQFSGLNRDEITAFCNDTEVIYRRPRVNVRHELLIRTDDGDIRIGERDWILKFENGALAGCDNVIFKHYYEPIDYEEVDVIFRTTKTEFLDQYFEKLDKLQINMDFANMMKDLKGENDEHVSD